MSINKLFVAMAVLALMGAAPTLSRADRVVHAVGKSSGASFVQARGFSRGYSRSNGRRSFGRRSFSGRSYGRSYYGGGSYRRGYSSRYGRSYSRGYYGGGYSRGYGGGYSGGYGGGYCR